MKDLNGSEANTMSGKDRLQVNLCATFVIEPIEEALDHSIKNLRFPVAVTFAPYNQVFQELLAPHSTVNQCKGINCLFIRIEDWLMDQKHRSSSAQVDFLNQMYAEFIEALKQALRNTNVPFLIAIL